VFATSHKILYDCLEPISNIQARRSMEAPFGGAASWAAHSGHSLLCAWEAAMRLESPLRGRPYRWTV